MERLSVANDSDFQLPALRALHTTTCQQMQALAQPEWIAYDPSQMQELAHRRNPQSNSATWV
eukprot:1267783-Amphidinium_carterae.1